MMNRAQLLGNVGKDPEIRRTQDGRPIAGFSMATSDTWRDKQTGEKKEKVEWHRITCFNEAISKVIEQYVRKGSQLYVEGAIRTRKWTDQSGAERYSTEIVIEQFNGAIKLLGKPGGNGPPPANGEGDYGSTKSKDGAGPARHSELDDEIPFAPQVL